MAYYIMSEVKRGKFVPLDISKSELFQRNSKYKDTRYSLEEIDRFTSNFKNIYGLKNYLLKEEIIEPTLYDRPLSIRLPDKENGTKKVMYDFLYQNDRKYLDNPGVLINDIGRMQFHREWEFCFDYVMHFFKHHDCADIAPELRSYIVSSIRNGITDTALYAVDENGDIPIIRFTKQLIYNYHYNFGNIVYHTDEKIKYRNLHDIIAFCEYYHNNKRADEKNTCERGKVRTLKKEPAQLTFFGEDSYSYYE